MLNFVNTGAFITASKHVDEPETDLFDRLRAAENIGRRSRRMLRFRVKPLLQRAKVRGERPQGNFLSGGRASA